jgi:lysozyme
MALDPEYLDAIKGFEGYAPAASWDYKQYSSGYGTKAQPGDENIPPDQLKAVYEQRFQDEIAKAAAHVDSINPNLPPGVKAALTSLTYNAGPGWSQSGLGELVRSGDLQGAATRLQEYNKAGGEVNPVLVARRAKEASWFGGSAPAAQPQTASASPASPPSGPLQAIPQQAAPIFAQAQPQAQPQQAQGGGSLFGQMPAEQAMQAPPIFYAPRRSPDLSKLRAAFSQPVFSRG